MARPSSAPNIARKTPSAPVEGKDVRDRAERAPHRHLTPATERVRHTQRKHVGDRN